MIPTDREQRDKMILYMLEGIEGHESELTKWENDFINSIADAFNTFGRLSDRQCEILEKIYDKIS